MTSNPLPVKDDIEYLKVPTQTDFCNSSSINYALTVVAQEVAELLQRAYSIQSDDIDSAKTSAVRAVEENICQPLQLNL